jgi:hypothetical protein
LIYLSSRLPKEDPLAHQLQLFKTDNHPKKCKRDYTNVVVVTWTADNISILAQAPVPHADRSHGRRVLFVDYKHLDHPIIQAINTAERISRKNASKGFSGPVVVA